MTVARVLELDLIPVGSKTHYFVRTVLINTNQPLDWIRVPQPYPVNSLVEVIFTEKQDRLGNSYEHPSIIRKVTC